MLKHHNQLRRGAAVFGALAATFTLIACAAGPAASTPMPGAILWQANCGNCHNFRSPADYSDNQWAVIAQHMRVRANLPAADARTIEEFLKSSN